MLTTFNTVFGRYRFHRLPFGVISARDELQRRICKTYEGLQGVSGIVDDILVYGRSREEHDANLRDMLQSIRERGIKLNLEKSTICVQKLCFFRHKRTKDGLKPNPRKAMVIKELEPPLSKAELKTFHGMVISLSRFAPRLTDVTSSVCHLLKDKSEFAWDPNHDTVF